MITIGFCDDDLRELDNIRHLMDSYGNERKTELHYLTYESPYELLEDMEGGTAFDILFLDVIMPGQNGMRVAEEIREHDNHVKIIFLTASSEFAVQSYAVGAFFYQLKPVSEDSFFKVLDLALAECDKDEENCLIVKGKSSINRIPIKELEYCEVIGRTLFLHLDSGEAIELNGSMDELNKKLMTYGNFLRVHRSYLINLDFIKQIAPHLVSMRCNADIPIPHGKYNEIKDIYLEHIFAGGGNILGFADNIPQ